jgi:hypothetical protein
MLAQIAANRLLSTASAPRREAAFAERNQPLRDRDRESLKSLACELDDFAQSCVFKGLIAVSFRLFLRFALGAKMAACAGKSASSMRAS